MKITDIQFERLEGILETDMDLFQERLIRPIDIYPEHRQETMEVMHPDRFRSRDEGHWDVSTVVVHIHTDEGLSGISGPMSLNEAFFINAQLKSFLIGQNALATELIWDKMYRQLIHGRKGEAMFAVSAIDNALWDIRGKALGLPVYELLGGRCRDKAVCYSHIQGDVLEDFLRDAKRALAEGYKFLRLHALSEDDYVFDPRKTVHRTAEWTTAGRPPLAPG